METIKTQKGRDTTQMLGAALLNWLALGYSSQ